jgi:hypothetical protein
MGYTYPVLRVQTRMNVAQCKGVPQAHDDRVFADFRLRLGLGSTGGKLRLEFRLIGKMRGLGDCGGHPACC